MTLEEAIQHAKEKAEENPCTECGQDHRQLAEWLTELRDRSAVRLHPSVKTLRDVRFSLKGISIALQQYLDLNINKLKHVEDKLNRLSNQDLALKDEVEHNFKRFCRNNGYRLLEAKIEANGTIINLGDD